MNFKVSDLAPSGNEYTEILLKLPAEAEKKIDSTPFDLLPPFAVSNPHFGTLVSGGDAETLPDIVSGQFAVSLVVCQTAIKQSATKIDKAQDSK